MEKGQRVIIRKPGSFDVFDFEDFDIGEIRDDDVVVKMNYAAMNHLDLWVRRGLPGVTYPIVPCSEGVGVVVARGKNATFLKEGQRVLLSPGIGDYLSESYGIHGETCNGTLSTYLKQKSNLWIPLDDCIDDKVAAAFPLSFLTSWNMVVRRCNVKKGDIVFVWGAGSGVGHAAGQIAKLHGAKVIGTARGSKISKIDSGSWDLLLDPAKDDIVSAVRDFSPKGVDIVVEHTGAKTWKRSLSILKRNGSLVTCGGTTGPVVKINLPHLFIKNQTIMGSTMGSFEDLKNEILPRVANGDLKVLIDRGFNWKDIAQAHQHLEESSAIGKVLLKIE
ncbi:alcohol dehydrogenase [bacterium]|nr:alcohol dehydrogenase [bacterium]